MELKMNNSGLLYHFVEEDKQKKKTKEFINFFNSLTEREQELILYYGDNRSSQTRGYIEQMDNFN